MDVQYLFDSDGEWVAFRKGNHLFAPMGEWMGWFPWDDEDAVDTDGDYLGTVHLGERLYKFDNYEYRGYPGRPEHPGYPGYPGYPGHVERDFPPMFADDVKLKLPPLREHMRQLAGMG